MFYNITQLQYTFIRIQGAVQYYNERYKHIVVFRPKRARFTKKNIELEKRS